MFCTADPPQLSDEPAVLWLVPSKADCENVISTVGCRTRGVKRSVGSYYCQVKFNVHLVAMYIHNPYFQRISQLCHRNFPSLIVMIKQWS